MQQAYSSSSKFATTNLQPYPEPIRQGSNEWNSMRPWEMQLYKDMCRRAKSSRIRLVMEVANCDRAIAEVAWTKVGTVPGHTGLEAMILWAAQQHKKLTKLQQQCQQDLRNPSQGPPDDPPAPDAAPASGKTSRDKATGEGSGKAKHNIVAVDYNHHMQSRQMSQTDLDASGAPEFPPPQPYCNPNAKQTWAQTVQSFLSEAGITIDSKLDMQGTIQPKHSGCCRGSEHYGTMLTTGARPDHAPGSS